MEELGDILERLDTSSTNDDSDGAAPPGPADESEPCEICGGPGWYTADVPVGDPTFGKAITCRCQEERLEQEQTGRLLRYSNLGALTRFTFDSLEPHGQSDDPESQRQFTDAYNTAEKYAESPSGWLVLAGPHGSGKTHLAAAIGNRCIERGHVVFFSHVPDLLDHLRATFGPTSDTAYSELFELVSNTPLLILDSLGSHSTTAWADEKLRQIINHRYNALRPMVITTTGPLDELDPYIRSRVQTPGLSHAIELRSRVPDRSDRLGQIPNRMIESMAFESFNVRGNSPTNDQRRSLEHAHKFASTYAADPDGWLTIFGDTGVGKTHLAVAIAIERLKLGHSVFFIMVSDLLDHLRATFEPHSGVTYDQRFEEIKNTPLLILDDLGRERSSPWADEKLHQMIVHRHNTRLPTIITTMIDFTRPEEQGPIGSRIQDPSVGELIRLDAPDYRNKQRSPKRAGRPPARARARR